MSSDRELLRLQHAEQAARQRFDRLARDIRDADVLRHAKDLWLEAQAAVSHYTQLATPSLQSG
jgi:hypothetical protein